jgi:hypothetical protein
VIFSSLPQAQFRKILQNGMLQQNLKNEAVGGEIVAIDAPTSPYDHHFDLFQTYYRRGILSALANTKVVFNDYSLSSFPRVLRFLRRVRHSFKLERFLAYFGCNAGRALDRIAATIGGQRKSPSGLFHSLVGQYVFRMADGTVKKVCIDAHDSGEVSSPALLEWSDVYLKTSFWKSRAYDRKVAPLYNGNPLLLGHLNHLRSLRTTKPDYDLCFILRVWGGSNEVSGVEHNLRLLEQVAKCDCRKFIVAYLVAGDIPKIAARLDRQGIPWRLGPIKITELWKISASSRLNVIRLGLHSCVPWRMADLLAMGACPVLDQSPKTLWPAPLIEREHFLNLGVEPEAETCVASDYRYATISGLIEKYLSDENNLMRIRENNARYFDRNLMPESVGRYICAQVTEANTLDMSRMTA